MVVKGSNRWTIDAHMSTFGLCRSKKGFKRYTKNDLEKEICEFVMH